MIKTPLSTVIGGAFWTPGATVINGAKLGFEIVMKKLFANGEQGFWYDPSDMGTMYQDAAGTVPVTAVGQPVGLIRDKSGRNNHAFQTNSASRPILRKNAVTGANYLEFDAVDDRLTTNSFPSMGEATTLFVGSLSSRAGTAAVVGRAVAGYLYQTTTQVVVQSVNNDVRVAVSGNAVITAKYAASGTGVTLTVNGVKSTNQLTAERGYRSPNPLTIGAFDSGGAVPLSGRIYALIGVSKEVSDSEAITIEKEIAKRVGVTLNV